MSEGITETTISFGETIKRILNDQKIQEKLASEKKGLTVRLGGGGQGWSSGWEYALRFEPESKFRIGALHDTHGWLDGYTVFQLSKTGQVVTEGKSPVPLEQSGIPEEAIEKLSSPELLHKIRLAVEERKLGRQILGKEETQKLLRIEDRLVFFCQDQETQTALDSLGEADEETLGEPVIFELGEDFHRVVSLLPKGGVRVGEYYDSGSDILRGEIFTGSGRWLEKRDYKPTRVKNRWFLVSDGDHRFIYMDGFKDPTMHLFLTRKEPDQIEKSLQDNISFTLRKYAEGKIHHDDSSPRKSPNYRKYFRGNVLC